MDKLTPVDQQILDMVSQCDEYHSLHRLTYYGRLNYGYAWKRVKRLENLGLLRVQRHARRPLCIKINGGKHE